VSSRIGSFLDFNELNPTPGNAFIVDLNGISVIRLAREVGDSRSGVGKRSLCWIGDKAANAQASNHKLAKSDAATEICAHRHCFPVEPSISLILRLHMGYLLVFLVVAMAILEGLS
jgi:hypothetical protein